MNVGAARDDRLRLLCFPYAGGGASAYRTWQARLPSEVEVCPVQLPGREDRLQKPALRSLDALIALLLTETEPLRRGRFAFFGHSLGALVAFELTRALRRRGERLPLGLFVSACRAPHTASDEPRLSGLDDAAFVSALRDFAGTPEAVLRAPELLALVLPTLRADLALRDGYVYRDEPPLPLPIAAFGGEDDAHVSPAGLSAWEAQAPRGFSLSRYPGGHFFFRDQPAFFLSLSVALLRLSRRGGARSFELEASDGTVP